MIKNFKFHNDKCERFAYIGSDGQQVFKPKRQFETEEEALLEAFRLNTQPKQLHKTRAYKCYKCGKWHVGRTPFALSEEDRTKYKEKLNKRLYEQV